MFSNLPHLEKIQVVVNHEQHQKIHLSLGESGAVHNSTGERPLYCHPVLYLRNKQQPWFLIRMYTFVNIIEATLVYLYSMQIKV